MSSDKSIAEISSSPRNVDISKESKIPENRGFFPESLQGRGERTTDNYGGRGRGSGRSYMPNRDGPKHIPIRTSSAPPDEGFLNSFNTKVPHFVPTKTRDATTLSKSSDVLRKGTGPPAPPLSSVESSPPTESFTTRESPVQSPEHSAEHSLQGSPQHASPLPRVPAPAATSYGYKAAPSGPQYMQQPQPYMQQSQSFARYAPQGYIQPGYAQQRDYPGNYIPNVQQQMYAAQFSGQGYVPTNYQAYMPQQQQYGGPHMQYPHQMYSNPASVGRKAYPSPQMQQQTPYAAEPQEAFMPAMEATRPPKKQVVVRDKKGNLVSAKDLAARSSSTAVEQSSSARETNTSSPVATTLLPEPSAVNPSVDVQQGSVETVSVVVPNQASNTVESGDVETNEQAGSSTSQDSAVSIETADEPSIVPAMTTDEPSIVPAMTTDEPSIVPSMTTDEPSIVPAMTTDEPSIVPAMTTDEPSIVPSMTTDEPSIVPSMTTDKPSIVPAMTTDEPSTAPALTEIDTSAYAGVVSEATILSDHAPIIVEDTAELPSQAQATESLSPSPTPTSSSAVGTADSTNSALDTDLSLTPSESQPITPNTETQEAEGEGDDWEGLDVDITLPIPISPLEPTVSSAHHAFEDEDVVDDRMRLSARSVAGQGKKTLKKMQISSKDTGSILDAYEAKPVSDSPVMDSIGTSADVQVKPPVRSLRPGGGGKPTLLTVGPRETDRKLYSKADILAYASAAGECPPVLECYGAVIGIEERKPDRPSSYGHEDSRWSKPHSQHTQQSYRGDSSHQGASQQDEWKKARETGGNQQRRRREPVGPMVKRVISDPIELFSRQVQDILNKITPQTFGKLTEKLKDIPINTYTFLELLISKVFEKAVQEPNFANLYADMCVALEEKSACWGFVQVVYVKDANQHIWVKDIPMDNDTYAGPFATVKESLQAGEHINTIQLTLAPGPLEIHKIVAVGNSLITILRLADKHEDLYVSVIPYDSIDASKKSEKAFPKEESARQDAMKKNSVKYQLICECQADFENALNETGIYGSMREKSKSLYEEGLSEDAIEAIKADLELLEHKLKRRIVGNIRFIGELCKASLVKTKTIYSCFEFLIGNATSGWKEDCDTQSIELLCKLLHTVGDLLDSKSTHKADFSSLFDKLVEMSTDKRFEPRARFAVQEVLELRKNNWQSRHAQEGPALVADIRMKAAQEEFVQHQQQQMMQQKGGRFAGPGRGQYGQQQPYGRDGRGGGRGDDRGSFRQDDRPRHDVRILANTNQPRMGLKDASGGFKDHIGSRQVNFREPVVLSVQVVDSVVLESPVIDSEKLQRRVNVIIDEYFSNNSMPEAFESVEELPPRCSGVITITFAERFINSRKPKDRNDLVKLLESLSPRFLTGQSAVILQALSSFDPLVALSETICDIKEAPELLGAVFTILIAQQVIQRSECLSLIESLRSKALEDEFSVAEQVKDVYNRLAASLK